MIVPVIARAKCSRGKFTRQIKGVSLIHKELGVTLTLALLISYNHRMDALYLLVDIVADVQLVKLLASDVVTGAHEYAKG